MAIGFLAFSLMEVIKEIKTGNMHWAQKNLERFFVLFAEWTLHFVLGFREMDYYRIGPERDHQPESINM